MKEQTRNPVVQINEEKIGKLPKKEFRIMKVKIIKNLENRIEKMQESINKNLKELKELRMVSEAFGTISNAPTFEL